MRWDVLALSEPTDNQPFPTGLKYASWGLLGGLGILFIVLVTVNLILEDTADDTLRQNPVDNAGQHPEIKKEDLQRWIQRDGGHGHSDTSASSVRDTLRSTEERTSLSSRWADLPEKIRRGFQSIGMEETVPVVTKPGFELTTPGEDSVRLRDYRGQWVLVNFWATWCFPCREEMPSLERLDQSLPDDRFQLIAVDIRESDTEVRMFLDEHDVDITIAMDRTGDVANRYHVRSVPVTWLIDPKGRITGRILGPRHWDQPPARDVFEDLVTP